MRTFAIQPDHSAARRLPGVALLLTVAAFAVYAAPSLARWLQFSRVTHAGGQWWRVMTCHWTHWSWDHLLWGVLVFAVLGIICELIDRARMVLCLVASAFVIPMALWWLDPGLESYRGLSGLDSALFTLLLSAVARLAIVEKRWGGLAMSMLILAVFGGKVMYESVTGSAIFADAVAGGFEPVPFAHVVGAAVGLVCGLVSVPGQKIRRALSGSRVVKSGLEPLGT
jgi:rhomboid family GlyGly-CTERM serine protease